MSWHARRHGVVDIFFEHLCILLYSAAALLALLYALLLPRVHGARPAEAVKFQAGDACRRIISRAS